jgi:nucleoside-diphosphate-sugar epimerase
MTGEQIFITGGSGFVGCRVIFEALSAGYKVRAAVRSQSKFEKILATPSIKALRSGTNLEFIIVPDILTNGAYDNCLNGVTYIIHVASPLTSRYQDGEDMNEYFIKPAVAATMNILEAAKKASSIKRIVITSSIVAILPADALPLKEGVSITEKNRTPFLPGPYPGVFHGYCASKTKALNDSETWMETEKPHFDLVNILPSFLLVKMS